MYLLLVFDFEFLKNEGLLKIGNKACSIVYLGFNHLLIQVANELHFYLVKMKLISDLH